MKNEKLNLNFWKNSILATLSNTKSFGNLENFGLSRSENREIGR
jgi:hypothetical protein